MHASCHQSPACCQNPPALWRLRWPLSGAVSARGRILTAHCLGGNGGSGNGRGGSGGGGSGGGSGGAGSHGPWRSGLLGLAAAWALVSEVWSAWEYQRMASRDAQRRAALFGYSEPDLQHGRPQHAAAGSATSSASTLQAAAAAAAAAAAQPRPSVSIIVPVLNEEAGLEVMLRYLQRELSPAADEIIVVDGGSADRTVEVARRCGVRVLRSGRGRARQMNAGAAAAKGNVLVFAHADTRPPPSLLAEVASALQQPAVVLGGFRPVIEHDGRPLRFFSANNTAKTYYLPLLLRPLSFLRGLRCLFGDQTLFCRADDFRRVGGYDSRLPIMEDADLCIRLHMAGPASRPQQRGRVVQINSVANTASGRRLASWSSVHATVVHAIIGASWYLGASPQQLVALYHRLYTDMYR